jgi:hypothetical protein
MGLVGQFREIEETLPEGWQAARLRLVIPDEGDCARAAALLSPTNPGRHGKVINFTMARRGVGVGPDRIRELLKRLDEEKIDGELEALGTEGAAATAEEERAGLAAAWDEAVTTLPPDWSDVYAEVELTSSDYIEPGAVRLGPLNPTRPDARPVFRFRAARNFGYGAAPEMVRRCLGRLDEAGIRGDLQILRAFSDSYPAKTQGPVWYVGGKVL